MLAVLEFGLELAFAFALLRKIHRNAPRLVLREQLGRRSQRRALAALFASKRHLTLSEKRLWWADFHGPPHSTSASADLSLSPLKGRCGSPAVGGLSEFLPSSGVMLTIPFVGSWKSTSQTRFLSAALASVR